MADEMADVSKQLVFCIRWFDNNLEAHEEFTYKSKYGIAKYYCSLQGQGSEKTTPSQVEMANRNFEVIVNDSLYAFNAIDDVEIDEDTLQELMRIEDILHTYRLNIIKVIYMVAKPPCSI